MSAIGNYQFKLLAEILHIGSCPEKIGTPIDGILGLFEHLSSHSDELGHNAIFHQVENSAIIVVLFRSE